MIIDFFLHSAETGALLTGATPTVAFCKRVDGVGAVTDLDVDDPSEVGGGLYRFTIPDSLFLPGTVISYELDCGDTTSEGRLSDHLSPGSVSDLVLPAETLSQADLTMKRGDLLPVFERVLIDERGNPIDLSGDSVTVTFRMKLVDGDVLKVNAEADIVSAKHGRVRYEWTDSDTSIAGLFHAEFIVSDGPRTLPSSKFYVIEILSSLAD